MRLPPSMKNIIDKIGPPKFKYHITSELIIIRSITYLILLIKNLRSSRPHFINGPTIIPKVNGIIIGERIELKNGAPTEIFLSNITLEKIGYIVPISIVKVKDSIKMLFKEITPSLDKKLISLWFLLSRILRNFIKPNNVITKSKKSMNKPLLGSLANA